MLTGFEALGAASAVLQVISFTGGLVPLCYSIYDGKPTQEAELEDYAKHLIDTAGRLEARFQALPKITPDEKLLAETAQKCITAASDLKVETDYVVKLCRKGKLPKAIHAAFRSARHKNKIERQEKILQQCRQVMETELLFKICNINDAVQHRQTSEFQNLEKDIQTLISRIAQGYSQIEDLVKCENHMTRDFVREESKITREQVSNHVTSEFQALAISTISDKQRERLLKSLKAPEMNQRYHNIMDHADATFERVFRAYEGLSSERYNQSNDSWETLPSEEYSQSSCLGESLAKIDKAWDCFTSWLRSDDNRIFWVKGKPGSGKSTLVKFVIESHQTRQLLDTWRPGARVISHFFWKIGSPTQNTIHGLLCGLLHQRLSNDEDMMSRALIQFDAALSKDSTYDWSERELQAVLFSTLRTQTQSTCIFIDGLDEVSNKDGYLKLMKVVEELNLCNNVKVCVSSRPEPQLVNRHLESSSLRLEDLTRPDMTAFVRKELMGYRESGQLAESMGANLTQMLLYKAEGVFLWLSLAMRSVISGIQNNDTDETLIRRLSELPAELEGLYTDMWTRMNGENSIYRQTAARYFRYVIAGHSCMETAHSSQPRDYRRWNLTLAQVAIAESRTVNDDPRLQWEELSLEELKRLCATTIDDIQKRCVGLLQLMSRATPNDPSISLENSFTYIMQEPEFIHRTAHDFLVETEAGQRILNNTHGSFLSIDIDLRIFKSITRLAATLYKEFDIKCTPNTAIVVCARLAKEGYSETTVLRMLKDLCSQRLLVFRQSYNADRPNHHFISLLVNESPLLDSFIEPLLQQADSPSAATDVLRDITKFWVKSGSGISSASTKLVYGMLRLGADPHVPGFPLKGTSGYSLYCTAFGLFLFGSLQTIHIHLREETDYSESDCIMYNLTKVINALAQTRPNWDERLLILGVPGWPLSLYRKAFPVSRSWVIVEVNLQFLRRLMVDVPIFEVELHDLARSPTEPVARIRYVGKGEREWRRIKKQQPFEDLIDLVFRPVGFQEEDLHQFERMTELPGNAVGGYRRGLRGLPGEVPGFLEIQHNWK